MVLLFEFYSKINLVIPQFKCGITLFKCGITLFKCGVTLLKCGTYYTFHITIGPKIKYVLHILPCDMVMELSDVCSKAPESI